MKKLGLIILLFMGFTKVHASCATQVVPVPVVDSITVDIAGNVTICWQPVADPDLAYYVIFMLNPLTGANDSIDSLGIGTNCYTIPAGSNNSDIESVEFGVVAVDICNWPSLVGQNYNNTIYLEQTPDPCSASILLNWNAYDDFVSGVNVLYQIYVSTSGSGGPYSLAGTSTSTDFTYTGVSQGSIYDFYVRAIENSGAGPYSSSSNDVHLDGVNFLKEPAPTYLYTASVVDSQEINVQFYVDTAADISSYVIKRATDLSGPYSAVGSVAAYQNMNPMISYSDGSDVNANSNYYYYRIEAINICGAPTDTSNIGRTIWLKAKSDGINATNTLTITPYDGWKGNVLKYDIYRAVAGVWETYPTTSIVPFGDTTTYVDDITDVFQGNGEYCYKVIATEGAAVHVGGLPSASSISNESCVLHEPLLYVPNAFDPLSPYNPLFKPVLTFANPDEYLFQIYNRWGQKVFETKDVNEAWNGRMNNSGELCKLATYVYLVKFQSAKGEDFEKRGKVTLLR